MHKIDPYWCQLFLFQSLSRVWTFATPWTAAHRIPCLPLSPRVCSNPCPLSQWCQPTISSSAACPVILLPSIFPSIRVFFNELALRIRWPKYWGFRFSISPSNKYSVFIFFRIDWFDLLGVQGTQESSPIPQVKNINSSVLSFIHSPTLTYIHEHWKKHSLRLLPCPNYC